MQYDFETLIDRRGQDAMALDAVGSGGGFAPDPPKDGFDFIPLWVADMNFPTARSIQEEIIKRAQHPMFGYFAPSDEIWSDLILNSNHYTPAQSVNEWAKEHTAAFYAPSKTFNLAGLIGSYHIIYNKPVRERVRSISQRLVYNQMNVLSEHALIGAYSTEGESWLSRLLPVLDKNADFAYDYIKNNFTGVKAFKPEGTYMMLLDCEKWLKNHGKTIGELLKSGWNYGIGWQDGRQFDAPSSIRINLASPYFRIEEAFDRMNKYVFNNAG